MIEWVASSCILILAVIALRYLLRGRISLRLQYALWLLVLARLLIPVSFGSSDISVMSVVEKAPAVQAAESVRDVDTIWQADNGTVEGYPAGPLMPDTPVTVVTIAPGVTNDQFGRMESALTLRKLLLPVWWCGAAVTLMVFLTANLRFAARLRKSRRSLTVEQEQRDCAQALADCETFLTQAAAHLPSIHDQMLKTQNAAEYSAVSNTSQSQDGLVWLSGYLPAADADGFKKAAAEAHWAWAMEDPAADDDKVPTKVKYNKVTRLMIPVFDILGTVPGYREYDISFWFLGFFTLFFAMIIGDAGYGCLFLLAALALTVKNKKASTAVQLLWVLSIATIIWGALTGTWFGLEQAMNVPFLKRLVIPTFANYPAYFNVSTTTQQNTIMKFCFILGTVQLSLACVMNIRRKLKERDLSWVADLGWLAAIDALYFVVLYLVIGQQVNLIPVACVVIAGFLLVVCFGGMAPDKTFAQGLKAGLGNAFTVFLNTISAFGNIMSYIRLFAVGMASLAIAQSFNNMAFGFKGPLVIAAILILLIGHGLNIVMGLLSVVVHGVRLNLLEFSGQLGMEWAGIAYDPFRKRDKIKK